VVWPKDGAERVPVDTPLVVSRYGVPDEELYSLTSEDGAVVPLTRVERLAPPFGEVCGRGTTYFLRPESSLEPNAVYTLRPATSSELGATFTTGTGTFTPEPFTAPELTYLHVEQPDCTRGACRTFAEARIDLGANPETPRWVTVESAAAEGGRNVFMFVPEDVNIGSAWQLSVSLPQDDRCIDVTVYGLEGAPLFEEHRCEPDRCVRYANWGQSSCGGPPSSTVDVERIPDGTCDDPPELRSVKGHGIVYPGEKLAPDAGPRAIDYDDGYDCHVAQPGSERGPAWWIVIGLGLVASLARRPRLPSMQ
jgi:hypothetical protein